jgi:hypothetical protein
MEVYLSRGTGQVRTSWHFDILTASLDGGHHWAGGLMLFEQVPVHGADLTRRGAGIKHKRVW